MDDPANVFDHARLRLDGRLYFKVIPDFEDRKGTGNGTSNSNFYEARITVSQASNSQIKDEHTVVVQITNEEESPVFVGLDQDLNHTEHNLFVAEINAVNPEPLQEIKFEITSQKQGDSVTDSLKLVENEAGVSLVFTTPPAFDESPGAVNPDYELVLKVYEVDDPSKYAEHNLSISIIDGYELPGLYPADPPASGNIMPWELNVSTNFWHLDANEDSPQTFEFALEDLNASDVENKNLYSSTGPESDPFKNTSIGINLSSSRISKDPIGGEAWIEDGLVKYKLNQDFYGADTFTVAVSNFAGHSVEQVFTLDINGSPDDPVINLLPSYNAAEESKTALVLDGYDPDILDSNQSGNWGLDAQSNKTFQIVKTSNGRSELRFIEELDYENDDGNLNHQTMFDVNLTWKVRGFSCP